MYYLGIDIGAVSAKAVIVKGNSVISMGVIDTGSHIERVADAIFQSVLS